MGVQLRHATRMAGSTKTISLRWPTRC